MKKVIMMIMVYRSRVNDVDGVYNYGCDVLIMGLLWHRYHDGIKERWEPDYTHLEVSLVFKASRRRNYSIEAAILLLQQQYLLSPRKAAQLTFSRFVIHMEKLDVTSMCFTYGAP